jgi:cell division protein FtsB
VTNGASQGTNGGSNAVLNIVLTEEADVAAMVTRSRFKAFLTGVALYAIAAALIGYFGVNAYTGKYGLNAQQELDAEIVTLTAELARLKQERKDGEQRIALLRSDSLDPDMLDERVRAQLNFADPHDLVRTIKK